MGVVWLYVFCICSGFFFFFFKQKTAYEMRISDWSSDVCSSDLLAGVEACRTTPVTGAPRAPYCLMGVCFECLVTIDGTGNRQGCLMPLEEIGRASCRERVCQYV